MSLYVFEMSIFYGKMLRFLECFGEICGESSPGKEGVAGGLGK